MTSLAVILVALLAGGVTATVFYLQSEEALQEKVAALKGEGEARRVAETRREEAERERTRAQDAEEGKLILTKETGLVFVLIPGGKFRTRGQWVRTRPVY